MPASQLAEALGYAKARFELGPRHYAHAFAKASTVAPMPSVDLEGLRNAGLLNVNFGLESGCQDLLDLVKRGQKLGDFRQAVSKLCDIGIGVSINVIGGLMAEKEMARQTETFERELGAAEYLFVPM